MPKNLQITCLRLMIFTRFFYHLWFGKTHTHISSSQYSLRFIWTPLNLSFFQKLVEGLTAEILWTLSHLLMVFNCSIIVVIYSIFSKNFRSLCTKMFCCQKDSTRTSNTQLTLIKSEYLTTTFWSWVLERSLQRKNWGSANLENLLDFVMFFILSFQYDITL